jgi:hypothetical protein
VPNSGQDRGGAGCGRRARAREALTAARPVAEPPWRARGGTASVGQEHGKGRRRYSRAARASLAPLLPRPLLPRVPAPRAGNRTHAGGGTAIASHARAHALRIIVSASRQLPTCRERPQSWQARPGTNRCGRGIHGIGRATCATSALVLLLRCRGCLHLRLLQLHVRGPRQFDPRPGQLDEYGGVRRGFCGAATQNHRGSATLSRLGLLTRTSQGWPELKLPIGGLKPAPNLGQPREFRALAAALCGRC